MEKHTKLVVLTITLVIFAIIYWFVKSDVINDNLKFGKADDIFIFVSLIASAVHHYWVLKKKK